MLNKIYLNRQRVSQNHYSLMHVRRARTEVKIIRIITPHHAQITATPQPSNEMTAMIMSMCSY